MKNVAVALIALFVAACGAPPSAPDAVDPPDATVAVIEVIDPWIAQTPGGVTVSAGYLTLRNNTAEADALIAVSSPRAGRAEIHEMAMEGDVMRMRPLPRLELPAGGAAELAPGGAHLMFFDVAEPFTEGQSVPVTLTFERSGSIDVSIPVRRGQSHGEGH